ncbi:replicative helicase loader/inhibitor [Paenibacillus elgii]|uniref:replicative helicase loader/inhibitor n=1 Tax=Paenibacillus elgii TaxID=189691 RepID=UPI0013D793FD|nr:replicative helicase loader/inhibitor [Paenibacillus elgii]
MDRVEVIELFMKIKRHYASFDVMDVQKIDEWHRFLKDVPSGDVNANLDRYIAREKYPPTIAELVKPVENTIDVYHQHMKESAASKLNEIEAWREKAIPPPDDAKERMRQIASGTYRAPLQL